MFQRAYPSTPIETVIVLSMPQGAATNSQIYTVVVGIDRPRLTGTDYKPRRIHVAMLFDYTNRMHLSFRRLAIATKRLASGKCFGTTLRAIE